MQIPAVCHRLSVLVLFRLYAQCIDLTARVASRGVTSSGGSSGRPGRPRRPGCGLFWVSFSSFPGLFVYFFCIFMFGPQLVVVVSISRTSTYFRTFILVALDIVAVVIVISVVQEIVVCKH